MGIESTIIAVQDDSISLLRPGGITVEQLEEVTGPGSVLVPDPENLSEAHPVAPGQLKEHYAPLTPLVIQQQITKPETGQRVGLLTLQLSDGIALDASSEFEFVEELSSTGDLAEAATQFFAAIRRLDANHLDMIIATPFPSEGLGLALNDRLNRAAHR